MQQRGRFWRRSVILAAALAVIFFVSVTALGFPAGALFGIGVGIATAVAAFSGSREDNCLPRFWQRWRA